MGLQITVKLLLIMTLFFASACNVQGQNSSIGPNFHPGISSTCSSYRHVLLSYSPVGYWPMSETAGPTVNDFSSYANNGTYTGLAVFGFSGPLSITNGGIGTTGTGTVFNIPDQPQLDSGTKFTVMSWVYLTDYMPGIYAMIAMGKLSSAADCNYAMYVLGGTSGLPGQWNLEASNGGALLNYSNFSSVLSLNKWHMLVATFDNSSGTYIYTDGNQDAAYLASPGPTATNNIVLRTQSIANEYSADVAVFNYALSPAAIQAIYSAATSSQNCQ